MCDIHGLFHSPINEGILGSTAPGRIVVRLDVRALHEGDAAGFVGEARQSSTGPYPPLLYTPAIDASSIDGDVAFTGRGVAGGGAVRGIIDLNLFLQLVKEKQT